METADEFYNRCFVNFNRDKVFVFKSPKHMADLKSIPSETWSTQTAKNYINYLENEKEKDM